MQITADKMYDDGNLEAMSVVHCFIVDNDDRLRELIALVVEDLSLRSTATVYSSQAYQQIESIRPDLLVIDLEFGQDEWWELLNQVQRSQVTRHIPVLCLSTTEALLCRARTTYEFAGGAHFLLKPFDIADIEKAVRTLLPHQSE